jgi:hypothetical protein
MIAHLAGAPIEEVLPLAAAGTASIVALRSWLTPRRRRSSHRSNHPSRSSTDHVRTR